MQKYLVYVESLASVPIDIISTGPDRKDTIVLRHPYANGGNEEQDMILPRRGLEPPRVSPQASSLRVYQFHHPGG